MTTALRLLDCLYLRPTANHQGEHELLRLQTNRPITRPRVTAVSITPSIIKMVHEIAMKDNMPRGLKIKNRSNVITFDASWTAGVDYDEELFEDEEDTDYDSSQSSEETSQGDDLDEMDNNELADVLEEQYVLEEDEDLDEEDEDLEDEDIEEENEDIPVHEALEDDQDNVVVEDVTDEEEAQDDPDIEIPGVRKSARVSNVPTRLGDFRQHLHATEDTYTEEYGNETAHIIAHVMCHYTSTNYRAMSKKKFYQLAQTYSFKKGSKKFGMRAKKQLIKK